MQIVIRLPNADVTPVLDHGWITLTLTLTLKPNPNPNLLY